MHRIHRPRLAVISLACAGLFLGSTAKADDVRAGKALHDSANCVECHVSRFGSATDPFAVYKREDRRVNNFNALVSMVDACNVNLDVGWFPDEVEQVARYLEDAHYDY
ncbi:MAG: cytochrome c [Thioalkalivibrionaceae bacterium]